MTGASRGIGAAIATDLVSRGFRVVALSRSGTAPAGEAVSCDVADEPSVVQAIRDIAANGAITGLVNNAGMHSPGAAARLSAADFEQTLRVNTTSVLVVSREVYPHLVAAGGGLIVNIGSLFDRFGVRNNVAYCASKAAVGAVTRCLAAEWARDGIRVVNVAPGYIETELNRELLQSEPLRASVVKRIPAGRLGHADEVARLVGALFVEQVGFLTGETIYLDGGQGIRL